MKLNEAIGWKKKKGYKFPDTPSSDLKQVDAAYLLKWMDPEDRKYMQNSLSKHRSDIKTGKAKLIKNMKNNTVDLVINGKSVEQWFLEDGSH
jgi:hypothetical protein